MENFICAVYLEKEEKNDNSFPYFKVKSNPNYLKMEMNLGFIDKGINI